MYVFFRAACSKILIIPELKPTHYNYKRVLIFRSEEQKQRTSYILTNIFDRSVWHRLPLLPLR